MKILVSGATGQQGGAVVQALLKDVHQVVGITRNVESEKAIALQEQGVEMVSVDFTNMEAMIEVMKGRTTYIIAHRLNSVREADTILVLADGAVVEQGNHDELIARNGIYREIFDLQLRPQEEVLLDATIIGDDGGDS